MKTNKRRFSRNLLLILWLLHLVLISPVHSEENGDGRTMPTGRPSNIAETGEVADTTDVSTSDASKDEESEKDEEETLPPDVESPQRAEIEKAPEVVSPLEEQLKVIGAKLDSIREEYEKFKTFRDQQKQNLEVVKQEMEKRLQKQRLLFFSIGGIVGVAAVVGIALAVIALRQTKNRLSDDEIRNEIETASSTLQDQINQNQDAVKEQISQIQEVQQGWQGIQDTLSFLQSQTTETPKKSIDDQIQTLQQQVDNIILPSGGDATTLEKIVLALEAKTQQRQAEIVDAEALSEFQRKLDRFDEELSQIQPLLSISGENFARAREEYITSALRQVKSISAGQPQLVSDDNPLDQRFANALLNALRAEVQFLSSSSSFDELRRKVNLKSLAQRFARYVDDEYQSNPRHESRIEPHLKRLFEAVGIQEIRPRKGERYNPRYHQVHSQERRADTTSGRVSRTYVRGFMENGEILSQALIILAE